MINIFTIITSSDVWVFLETSMHFIGIGLSVRTFWLGVPRDVSEISHNGPEIIFSFRLIPVWSHLGVEIGEESSSDSPRTTSCSSPRSGRSRIQVDVLRRKSPAKILTVPSATGNIEKVTIASALTLPLHWAFWRGVLMRPSRPNLQCLRPKCLLSRFLQRTIRNGRMYLARLLDQIDVVSICPSQR